jgi:hypothetical protein
MRLRHVVLFILLWFGGVLAYKFWPENEIVHAAGVLVPEEPQQSMLDNAKSWKKDEYTILPLAEFKLRARVLHKKLYSRGREADLSPVDLVLGWGKMSDQKVMDQITVTQHSRWYYWRAENFPIAREAIIASSSNMHMIPATVEVEELLKSVRPGSLIQLSGYLVSIKADDGWKWKSSLSRKDTGNGSCELVWVKQASVQESL